MGECAEDMIYFAQSRNFLEIIMSIEGLNVDLGEPDRLITFDKFIPPCGDRYPFRQLYFAQA